MKLVTAILSVLLVSTSSASAQWSWLYPQPQGHTLNDIVFLLLSGVLGILWFIVAVVGLSVGGALAIVGVGIPILAATIGALVWGTHLERSRIRVFLGIDIPSPYRDLPQDGGWIKRGWRMLRTQALWRDVAYLLLLFPVGLLELTIALIPIQFLITPLITFVGGSNSILWWDVNSFPEAIFALLIGALLLVPLSIVINLMAIMHGEMAKRLLAKSNEENLTERVEELTESRSAVMKAMLRGRMVFCIQKARSATFGNSNSMP